MTGEMLADLANRGLKAMFVARPDACRVCRSMQGRVFDPLEAPALPLEQCLTPPCRCWYEGYDSRAVVSRLLRAGMDAVKRQRTREARELLYQVIDLDERNELAWLWLGEVAPGVDERIVCLENVLAINPGNQLAREGLRRLRLRRRETGRGQRAARRNKQAREAIAEIRHWRPKVSTLREVEPPPGPDQRESLAPLVTGVELARERASTAAPSEGSSVSFVVVFLWVLLITVFLA
ncbi:MAG TPA: hypothetical protein ENO24_09640, partial [Chloroflexi bacterium]|nr:hypothetical protein [Chloroflexota bacterium]